MGNKLTVANATDGDIYAYANVREFDIQKITAAADVGTKPSAALNFTLDDEDVKLGWIAVAPSKSWTFPKLVASRYFLTICKKGYSDLICNALQIAWKTNVIVTPDNKLAVAKSGYVWIDSSDDKDYSPKKGANQSRVSSQKSDVDTVDAAYAETLMTNAAPTAKTDEVATHLEQSIGIPTFLAIMFVTKCFELGEFEVDEIQSFTQDFLKSLGLQLAASSAVQPPSLQLLAEVLRRQDLFLVTPADVDYVIQELSANTEETEKLLLKLIAQNQNT